MAWEEIAEDKRSRIAASIPPEWRIKSAPTEDVVIGYPKISGIMSPEELAITESTAVDLVSKMAEGKLTSIAVTTAFCKRAPWRRSCSAALTNSFQKWPSLAPKNSTLTIRRRGRQLDLYTDFLFLSKINSALRLVLFNN
jgi:hypothetical protein